MHSTQAKLQLQLRFQLPLKCEWELNGVWPSVPLNNIRVSNSANWIYKASNWTVHEIYLELFVKVCESKYTLLLENYYLFKHFVPLIYFRHKP